MLTHRDMSSPSPLQLGKLAKPSFGGQMLDFYQAEASNQNEQICVVFIK